MSFTITRNLERVVSYSMLCKLAEQKHVHITGNEFTGSFSCRGVEGNYEWGEYGIQGSFAEHEDAKAQEHLPDSRKPHPDEHHEGEQLGYSHRKLEFSISFPSCHNRFCCRY